MPITVSVFLALSISILESVPSEPDLILKLAAVPATDDFTVICATPSPLLSIASLILSCIIVAALLAFELSAFVQSCFNAAFSSLVRVVQSTVMSAPSIFIVSFAKKVVASAEDVSTPVVMPVSAAFRFAT